MKETVKKTGQNAGLIKDTTSKVSSSKIVTNVTIARIIEKVSL